jgi:hypothetical protein
VNWWYPRDHFPAEKSLPVLIIEKIVKAAMTENETLAKK